MGRQGPFGALPEGTKWLVGWDGMGREKAGSGPGVGLESLPLREKTESGKLGRSLISYDHKSKTFVRKYII